MQGNNNNIKSMHQSANEYSLFVGDLPEDCSDDKLQRLFQSRFKSVKRVQIIKNEDGSSRGFGFIRFEDHVDFHTALTEGMKIGNKALRLDRAHRHNQNNRNRYNSFNSTGSNNSNHHHHHFNNNNNLHHQPHYHHHHNQPRHHPHHQQHAQQQQQQQQHGSQPPHHANHQNNNTNNNTNKTLIAEPSSAGEHQQALSSNVRANSGNSQQQPGPSSSNSPSAPQALAHQQHRHTLHNSLPNQGQYEPHQQHKNSSHQQAPPDAKNTKQTNLSLGGDEASQSQNQNQIQAQQQLQQHPSQQPLPQTQLQPSLPPAPLPSLGNSNNLSVAMPSQSIVATTSATTTLSSSNMNHTTNAVLNNHNINTNHQQSLGPDLRGYMPQAMMDSQHLMGAEQGSMMPQTSVYSYVYPYGPPPPFGYMHPPPPQPNPVIPISAVPPAPPNQASPSSGLSQQHNLTASNATRLNEAQHPHQPQPPHASTADASAITGTIPGGVQAPHQGPQFYYYYPSPLYFDQAGAAAPPNMYHPQSFHPQFFAMPSPAYMPNAHQQTYNQHQPQPPSASQSDAPVMGQQQPHQPQVNLRTRDIETTIE